VNRKVFIFIGVFFCSFLRNFLLFYLQSLIEHNFSIMSGLPKDATLNIDHTGPNSTTTTEPHGDDSNKQTKETTCETDKGVW